MLLSNAENWDAYCLDTGIFTIAFILLLLIYEITFKLCVCVCSHEFCSRPVDLGEQLAGVNSHFSFWGVSGVRKGFISSYTFRPSRESRARAQDRNL